MHRRSALCFACLPFAASPLALAQSGAQSGVAKEFRLPLEVFAQASSEETKVYGAALSQLKQQWRNSYAVMLLEMICFLGNEQPAKARLLRFLEMQTGQSFGLRLQEWHRWICALPYDPHPDYASFKGSLYANVDPRMQAFFPAGRKTESRIRLDQVEWGGVRVNGIPPLVNPTHIPAAEAAYLKDQHIIFGVALGDQARAYPKRILAWHEMARDTIDGQNLCLVYCTLCGTVIPYLAQTRLGKHSFGTSGLLYESSKLMFDEETNSLWATLQGQPVIGPLAKSGLQLDFVNVVTTSWGEWRKAHPNTRVLSLDTGHRRNYGEGVAYRDYFGTDELMFEVSRQDARLARKAEVLVIRLPQRKPLALSLSYLKKHPEWKGSHEGAAIEVFSSAAGSTKVLVDGQPFPAHRAFWFGWYAQFPATVLIR